MKIAILSSFYPLRGGIAQSNAAIYRALEKEHEVKAFNFSRQYPQFLFPGKTQLVEEGDHADPIPNQALLDSINPLSYRKTARAIKSFHPDLLIMRFWMPFLGPALGAVARSMSSECTIIAIVDNAIPHEKKFIDRPFTRYFLNSCDGFVVMSNSVKDDLKTLNPKSDKAITLQHPVYSHFGDKIDQLDARKTLGLQPDKKTLLFFGFIRDYKGLDLLIDAFGLLDESYQLVVAGECYGSFDTYQNQIDQSPRRADIHAFNRYINDDEVPAFFCSANVCVQPYRSATQSGISAIALHFDLPMIATDVGGLKETILHGENGLITDQISPVSIANSIKEYFDNGLYSQFSDNLRKTKSLHSWNNFVKKLLEFGDSL
jgi:glycosyltransferase involved in cell wall biosynthesis